MKDKKINKKLVKVLDEIAEKYGEITPGGYRRIASDRKLAPVLKTSGTGIGAWRSGESLPSIASEYAIAEARGWTRTQLVAVLEDEDPIDLICWGVYLLRLREYESAAQGTLEEKEDKYNQLERLQQAILLLSSTTNFKFNKNNGDKNNEDTMIKLSEQQANKLSRLILFLESSKGSGYIFFDDLDVGAADKEKLHMVIHFCQVERQLSLDTLDNLATKLPIVLNWCPIKVSNDNYANWGHLEKSLNGNESCRKK